MRVTKTFGFEAAHRLLAGRIVHARGVDDRDERGDAESRKQRDVGRLRQVRPHVEERDEEEQPGDAEHQPQARPQALEVEHHAAEPHLAGEGGVERGRGLCHQLTITGTLATAKATEPPPSLNFRHLFLFRESVPRAFSVLVDALAFLHPPVHAEHGFAMTTGRVARHAAGMLSA